MRVNRQFLKHLSCAVPHAAEIVSLGRKWRVSHVHREVVLVQERQKMSAEWLDCFHAVLEALQVPLVMSAHVPWIAEWGIFQVHHNLLGGNHMLAMMAHNSDILGLHQSSVVSLVSCWMGQGGRTGERLEMIAAKAGNNTPLVDEMVSWVTWIQCLCSAYFLHYYLMLPHCHLGIVVSETAHLLKPYWMSSAEIRS